LFRGISELSSWLVLSSSESLGLANPRGREKRRLARFHSSPRAASLCAPQVRNAARSGEVFLPDCSGRLAPSTSCIYCGSGVRTRRLLARIDPGKVGLRCPAHLICPSPNVSFIFGAYPFSLLCSAQNPKP
jgi:hypothetical protein